MVVGIPTIEQLSDDQLEILIEYIRHYSTFIIGYNNDW